MNKDSCRDGSEGADEVYFVFSWSEVIPFYVKNLSQLSMSI